MTQRPNVLLLCADQWRADCMSALGHPNVKTPNLDALAADGVLFTNHFGQCTPCGPSRTSLLTGLYLMNHRSGRNGTPLDSRHTNVALEVRKAGYRPTLFGYTDTSADPRELDAGDPALTTYESVMRGFEAALHLPDEMEEWIADLLAKGYDLPGGRADVFRPRPGFEKPADRGFRYIPTIYPAEHSEAAFLTDAFLKWLTVRRDSPWFAHFVFLRPHPPLIAPEPYNAMVHPADVELPARAASLEEEKRQHPMLADELDRLSEPGRYDEHSPFDPVSTDELEIRQMRAAYYGLVSEVDHHVGRIVDHLKASGQYERTLIIVTSDHAEMLGEHYAWARRPISTRLSISRSSSAIRVPRRRRCGGCESKPLPRRSTSCRRSSTGLACRSRALATAARCCPFCAGRCLPIGGRPCSSNTTSAPWRRKRWNRRWGSRPISAATP
jgi:arylsulfatase A-like enzyme